MHCFRVHISLWIHHFFMPWLFYLKGAAPESGEPSVPYRFGDEGLRADVRRRTWGWMKSWTWPGNVLSKPRKISCALGCIQSSVATRAREGILPLHSCETPPGMLRPALGPSCGHLQNKRMWTCLRESRGSTKVLWHLCSGDRLRHLGLFSLGDRRLWGDFIMAFLLLKRDLKERWGQTFQ